MYMRSIDNSNYDDDDRDYLTGFIEHLSEVKPPKNVKLTI